ncbi:MAG: flagellar basal body L-ring protein FlgH [Pseudomonadota bacterium]|nr:flagellar basal body L-ring protein FlgH [Pseudomonadota bacterium]QKK04925.1 MAG: flagellar basal body L-ring protein FlgH [Pseudomonadota bacterium]
MNRIFDGKIAKIAAVSFLALSLTACGSTRDRLAAVGQEPPLSPIENPKEMSGYRPVSLPMPELEDVEKKANSLWTSGRQAFFKDQRANAVGDILTVTIDIKDKANLENTTSRTRNNAENVGLPNVLGLETQLTDKFLPEAFDPAAAIGATSDSNSTGQGTIERDEEIQTKMAAMITEVLPNGNFVIYGRQETRVNFEVRELKIAGVIRPEDISTQNSISYDQIAEARISYGGRGQITDVQQPRYGQQVFDILFPF